VSRRIFQPLFPNWPESEVPVGHVTNGVHMPTWNSKEAEALLTGACGKDVWKGTVESMEGRIRSIPDSQFWQCRASARESFIEYVRQRHSRHLAFSNAAPEEIENAKNIFDANN
jgi:starch phosphorylase